MATKIHCDRCDIWLGEGEGHYPTQKLELPATFLDNDRPRPAPFNPFEKDTRAPLKLAVTVTQCNDGDIDDPVTLCDTCFEKLMRGFLARAAAGKGRVA